MRIMNRYILLGCISIALTFGVLSAHAAESTLPPQTTTTKESGTTKKSTTAEESGSVRPAPNTLIFMEKAPKRDLSKNKIDEENALRARGKGKVGQKNFMRCDSNKDGVLSSFEFRACFPRSGAKFVHVDANKDNKISEVELEEYISKLE